jgi:3-hydroxyisobutyrate dehydrogenase-like beta-hydroxyacid dehydrogenase
MEEMHMNERVGFIGIGRMGYGMAKNLLLKGWPLTAMAHRNRTPLNDLLALGAREAETPETLARESDLVFLCVSGSPQVEDLICRKDGLLAGMCAGQVVVDTSTSNPVSTRRMAALAESKGVRLVDAPVTGSPKDAEAGRLNSLVGAEHETFKRIRPALEAYSETVTHFGPVGAGHSAKVINNFVTCGTAVLLAEAMAAATAGCVDKKKLYRVMLLGAANSGTMRKMIGPLIEEGDLTGHPFAIANAAKDVSYFASFAQAAGLSSRMIEGMTATYAAAIKAGLGDKLMASLVELQERETGLSIIPGRS